MDSIHQAKLNTGYLLHKIALVQSQRNKTVPSSVIPSVILQSFITLIAPDDKMSPLGISVPSTPKGTLYLGSRYFLVIY